MPAPQSCVATLGREALTIDRPAELPLLGSGTFNSPQVGGGAGV